MKRYGFLAIAAVVFGMALPVEGQESQVTKFRMEWIPSGMYTPFYYGMDAGIFKKHGLNLEMLNGKGSLTAVDDVLAGHSDFGMSSCATLALSIGKGREIISIGQYTGEYSMAFYVPKDSPIASIKDFGGKTLVSSPGAASGHLLPAVFALANVDPDSVKRVLVAPSQKLATYARGVGDAVVTIVSYGDPLVQELKESRALKWADVGFVMPDYCILARKNLVKEDPAFVQRFLTATYEAITAADANPQAAVDATLKLNPLLKKEATKKQWEITRTLLRSKKGEACSLGWHVADDWSIALVTLQKHLGLDGEIAEPENRFYTNQFVKC